ncbi:uncharacterized protein LOC108023224 isoform X1 [Drosophila biarmipes]|uniref:uncharacterized protein LOC108023224 isoform X1 n=1 Tax=Drosophila biarmipes TaxID=125945 RepID=UPI0007E7D867|nr:uncharacterized protein LOC108023224 isoform X1 [Drosophila biarmipes]
MAAPLLWQNFKVLIARYPIMRGMISYSLIWPTGSLIQQTVEGRRWGTYDWWRVLRFSMYGGLFVAPTLYGWVKRYVAANVAKDRRHQGGGGDDLLHPRRDDLLLLHHESAGVQDGGGGGGRGGQEVPADVQGGSIRMAPGGHHQLHPDPRAQPGALHQCLQPVLDLLPGLHEAPGAPRSGYCYLVDVFLIILVV